MVPKPKQGEATDGLHSRETDLDALVIYNLQRTCLRLSPILEGTLRPQKLTSTQFNALLVLREAEPGGLVMGEIGRRLVVTKANVTGLVDRLERQGLVARSGHPDRRATTVKLTEEGRSLLAEAEPRHTEQLADLTSCLTQRQKETMVALLSKLRQAWRRKQRESE